MFQSAAILPSIFVPLTCPSPPPRFPSGARVLLALAGFVVACASDDPPSNPADGGAAGTQLHAGSAGIGGQVGRGGTAAVNGGAGQVTNGGAAGSGGAAGAFAASGAAGFAGRGGNGGAPNPAGGAGVGGASGGGASGGGAAGSPAGAGGTAGGTAGSSSAGTGGEPLGPVSVFIAGDSTVSTYRDTNSESDQAGWGQMIGALFDERVTIENRAVGGMTARHFIENGYLADIFEDIEAGDYLLVQFGTNDGNRTATYMLNGETIPYYLDPATDFKTYLGQYLTGARERGAIPVFVTPPPRNSAYCTGGNGTGAHASAMRELGIAENVAVSDLNAKSVAYLQAICPAPTPEDFFLRRADGSVDGTHFQEHGARVLAELVAEGLQQATLSLAAYLK
jgi:lysophospholipase L1-like esterase